MMNLSRPARASRRSVLAALSGFAAARLATATPAAAQANAPSAGPNIAHHLPAGACDCHHHIYDSRFPYVPDARLRPAAATVADYRIVQQQLGLSRSVIVTPSSYGTDNSCLLDALTQFGGRSRGIAVIDPRISDLQLKALDAAGVRGIRILYGRGSTLSADDVEALSRRIQPLGWHVQFFMPSARVPELAGLFDRLPTPIVFDHMGHIPQPEGMASGAYKTVRRLLDGGRTWVKLSGAYMDTRTGPPLFTDTSAIAKSYIAAAPERVIWGTNWPHPAAQSGETLIPDDEILLDLLGRWTPDPNTRQAILVENPEKLFGFEPTSRPKPEGELQ